MAVEECDGGVCLPHGSQEVEKKRQEGAGDKVCFSRALPNNAITL